MNLLNAEPFVISHFFEADVKTVYEMWIDPGYFSGWLGPEGAEMTFLSTEVREGGTSQWEMTTGDGQTKHGQINFQTINLNQVLIYTQNFCDKDGNFIKAPFSDTYPDYLLTTVHFIKEKGNQTKVTVKWEIYGNATEAEQQTFIDMKPVMKIGWKESFDKLASLLAKTSEKW